MKKLIIFLLFFCTVARAEVTVVGPGPKQVKPEDPTKKKKEWRGIAIAAGVVAIGIATCIVVAHQHNKHK